jgi:maltose alpha-D-glucosyltransferase/alpha-amylase
MAPRWHEERQVLPDLAVLVLVESGWRTLAGNQAESGSTNQLMVERARAQLGREILPRFFRSQPWFANRTDVEKFELGETHEWVTENGGWLLAIVILTLASGEKYRYAMPLALAWEDEVESRLTALLPAILAKVRRRARMGVLFDAFYDDAFCHAVISSMEAGSSLAFERGQVRFHATSAFPGSAPEGEATIVTRTVSERGRLLVNLGDRLILKGYRWLLAGVHPELEMSRFLTETANFPHIAQLAGTVEYVDGEGHCSTLAVLERYAENQGSAWVFTQDYLARYLDDCRTRQKRPIDARHPVYTTLVKTLGLRTAEFHQALAQPDRAGAFGMEPITRDDMAEWVNSVRAQMDQMFALLEAEWPRLTDAARSAGRELFEARTRFYRRITRAAGAGTEAMKARYHGDYNLRQVWVSKNDFLITNYGSGPERAWRERRWKHTPLRDVAGMLFSFSEAAAAALAHVTAEYPDAGPILQEQTNNWQALATSAFFKSYRRAMKEHPLFPSSAATEEMLVMLFMVEKAASSLSNALSQQSGTVEILMRQLIHLMQRKR